MGVIVALGLIECVTSVLPDVDFKNIRKRHATIAASILDAAKGATVDTTFYNGAYGYNSLTKTVSGHLVHVRSRGNVNYGCTDYDHDLPTHDWVALIERGQCYFGDKLRVATTQYNASGVIVYNNLPGSNCLIMHSFVKDEVYVLVPQASGRKLALLTDAGVHVMVNIALSTPDAAGTVC